MFGRVKTCLLLFLVLEVSFGGVASAASLAEVKKATQHKPTAHKPVIGHKKTAHKKSLLGRVLEGTAHALQHRAKHAHRHALEATDKEEDGDDNQDDENQAASDVQVTDEDVQKDIEDEKKKMKVKGLYFLAAIFVTIIVITIVAYFITNSNQSTTFWEFMQMQHSAPLNIFVGLSSGIVFGMIDNMGLFFGMEYLDPYFEDFWKGNEKNMSAGYGNTFSDFVGAFIGTFMGKIVFELAKKADPQLEDGAYPIWTEAVGITLGCIIGVIIPRLIIGDPDEVVMSKAASQALQAGVTQDEIDEVMFAFDKLEKNDNGEVKLADLITNTDDKVNAIIANADLDDSGTVSREEVLKSLRLATMKAKMLRDKAHEHNTKAHENAQAKLSQQDDDEQPKNQQDDETEGDDTPSKKANSESDDENEDDEVKA